MTTRKKTPKKATSKSNGLTAAPATALAKAAVHEVGASVHVSEDDAGALQDASGAIDLAQARLGALIEEFERKKLQLLQQVAQSRQQHHNLVFAIAAKYDIDLGPDSKQSWKYEPKTNVYERTA